MEAVDLALLSEAELGSLTRELHGGRRRIEGFLTQVAAEAARREDGEGGAPAEDVMRGGGAIAAKEATDLARRGRLGRSLPATGSAAEQGETRSANADLVAKTVGGLSAAERERLAAVDQEISSRAADLPPETFARWFHKLVRTVGGHHGRSRIRSRGREGPVVGADGSGP